jgi:hypothetical protein
MQETPRLGLSVFPVRPLSVRLPVQLAIVSPRLPEKRDRWSRGRKTKFKANPDCRTNCIVGYGVIGRKFQQCIAPWGGSGEKLGEGMIQQLIPREAARVPKIFVLKAQLCVRPTAELVCHPRRLEPRRERVGEVGSRARDRSLRAPVRRLVVGRARCSEITTTRAPASLGRAHC